MARPPRATPTPPIARPRASIRNLTLSDDEMARIAAMDTGRSQFFDHRDPAMVSQIGNVRVD